MGLDIDLYTPKIDIGDDGADDIIIEITGLKSISKFIGLEDTPLYYDNGKFFKVENNKIVYTDIQWKDISGNIEDAPEIVAFIKDLIEEISAEIVDDHITLHNIAKDAHPYIQNIIHENYVTLDTKIDDTKEELSQDISNLNDALNKEISDRETADNALSEDIQEEILARIEGDATLQGEIDTLNTNLQNEIDARIEGDTKLSNSLDELSNNLIQEVLNRQEQDSILQEQITSNYNTLDNKIDTEISNRTLADTTLQNNIDELTQTVEDNNTTVNNRIDETNDTVSDLSNTVTSNYNTLDNKIDTEISNRTSADATLQDNINIETLARQNADTVLQNNINTLSQTVTDNNTAINDRVDETNDAVSNLSDTVTSNYNTLDGKINSEISSRTLADTALQNNIDAEALARQNADATLQDNIDALSDTVSDNYTDLDGKISDLTTTVNDNDTAINSKVDGINTTLTTSINSLSNTVSSNYTTLDTKIDTTKTSLEGDINDLSTTVSNNYTTLDGKITNLTSTVNDNYTELDDRITTNTNDISTINNKIPNQASSSNQLADKNFVNSSIATNTANFIGTFNSVAELEAYSGTLTNNDYAFVATIDSVGNTLYDRYKYNANTQQWIFEYELNNSSFTAVQWASINSGATTENINQITTNANDIIDLQTNKQDKLTAGENIQINNNIISATDTTYTAGSGISIENNVISNTQISAVWGNIQGTLSDQTDLQAVLDLKADKTELNTAVSELNTNIQNEATTRAENDTLLQNNINTLSQTVTANYNTLDDKIDTEISDRTEADTTLQNNIDAEALARQNSDATLQSNIDALSDTVSDNYTTLDTKIDNTKNALDSDISDLSDTVTSNYNALDARITTNTGNIATNTSDIADLQTDKQDVILDLTTIRSNASSGKNASDTIATYGNIVTHNINEFATSAQGALADTALQPNDNISELINDANYITSEDLPTVNNGVLTIQVNGDDLASFSANQAGNTTANIVVPDSATWGNIQGTLSNQTDLLNALNAKQNIISDLSTIRSGATLGATALQPNDNISELNNDAGYITGITSSDVTTALGFTPYNSTNPAGYITSSALSPYAKNADLASVATSGSYNDLSNKPTIPSEVTESTVSDWGFTKNTGTVTSVNNISPVDGNVTLSIPDISNLANKDLSNLSTIGNSKFQAPLVSGTNIKTINNTSLLGSGNIDIQGGSTITVDEALSTTSTNPVQNKVITTELNKKIESISSSDVTTALGYTPYNSTNPAGYISGITSSDVTTALGYTPYNTSNPEGYISGIDSTDVVNALGYTPYNATNPDGFISGITSSDVTTALGYTPYNSTNPNNYQENIIENVKVNGDALTPSNKTINIVVPTSASDIDALPNTTTIEDLTTSTQLDAINSGATTTNIGQIATNTSAISTINSKIPSAASSTNQLADKSFVNSSIATSTATFRGTFDSVAELEAYSGEKDDNDYAFVTGVDSDGNTYYDRYKYNGTDWVFEYRLNNSSFTSIQWSAINSGANSTNIEQITTNTSDIADLTTNKQDVISDLSTIRSNASAGVNAATTIASYGNIVTHNVNEFATSAQGALADTALQPNDNISELTNNVGYITSSALAPYALSADLSTVATSGSYNDLSDKPTIPAPQVNSDWNATSGKAQILNKPNLSTVATSGDYDDLINKPSEITVDSALDSTSTNPVENRVIAQALEGISLAKNPNLNIIGGSLNIDSGNVSGFSTTDYMQFPFVFNFNSYHWTLEMGFTTGSAVTTQQNIFDSYYGIAFAIRNGKFVLAISSNGSSWDIANTEGTYSVQANTAYSVKIAWDGTNYTLSYALDETNYTTDITVASALVHHSTQEYVGGEPDLYGDSSQHPFAGTINLNNWKLTVNGLEVWLGMDDVGLGSRANIDLSNLTEAGQYMVDTVKDQNDGSRIKTWTGTKAEYDAIVTKDANTLYNITDDSDVTFQLLELIYPVGSIYIGTMSVCPLQTLGLGAWELVAEDRVLQGAGTRGSVGDTLNESLPNIRGGFGNPLFGYGTTDNSSGAIAGNIENPVAREVSSSGDWRTYNKWFDASLSSSTYKDNAPVQQDAYLVNIWRRIS